MQLIPIKYEAYVVNAHYATKSIGVRTVYKDDMYWVYPISRILILNKNSEISFEQKNSFEEDITGFDFDSKITVNDTIQYSEKPYLVVGESYNPTTYTLCIPEEMAKLSEPEYVLVRHEFFDNLPLGVDKVTYCGLLNCHFRERVENTTKDFFKINSELNELGQNIDRLLNHRPDSEDDVDATILSFSEKSSDVKKLFEESKRELQKLRNYTINNFFKENEYVKGVLKDESKTD